MERLRGANARRRGELRDGSRVNGGVGGDERRVDPADGHDRRPRREEQHPEADRNRAAAQRIEERGPRASDSVGEPAADEDARHTEGEDERGPLARRRGCVGRREPSEREGGGEERGEPGADDEELPRVSDVCADRADQRRVAKDAEIEMRALAGRLRDSARADRRDRQGGERDRAEDDRRPAPTEWLEQQTRREERERAAEIERRHVEAHRGAAARGVGALRDQPDAGHVHAREAEPRDRPKEGSRDDVVCREREREVRERGDECADRDDSRGPHTIGEREYDEYRRRVAEHVRGDDPPERRARRVPLGA